MVTLKKIQVSRLKKKKICASKLFTLLYLNFDINTLPLQAWGTGTQGNRATGREHSNRPPLTTHRGTEAPWKRPLSFFQWQCSPQAACGCCNFKPKRKTRTTMTGGDDNQDQFTNSPPHLPFMKAHTCTNCSIPEYWFFHNPQSWVLFRSPPF